MAYEDSAKLLQEGLKLALPPVAVKFVDGPPAGIQGLQQAGPSACSYWRKAEQGLFYASAADHYGCPIGAMVMGFDLPEAVGQELMGLVGSMLGVSYISEDEIANIPKVEKKPGGIVYGPLAGFPMEPDSVIVWPTPAQAMILQEWSGGAKWAKAPQGFVYGRPGCGAVAVAGNQGSPAMSLGCIGMRTFTQVPDDRCLLVIPGAALGEMQQGLQRVLSVNETMKGMYEAKLAS